VISAEAGRRVAGTGVLPGRWPAATSATVRTPKPSQATGPTYGSERRAGVSGTFFSTRRHARNRASRSAPIFPEPFRRTRAPLPLTHGSHLSSPLVATSHRQSPRFGSQFSQPGHQHKLISVIASSAMKDGSACGVRVPTLVRQVWYGRATSLRNGPSSSVPALVVICLAVDRHPQGHLRRAAALCALLHALGHLRSSCLTGTVSGLR